MYGAKKFINYLYRAHFKITETRSVKMMLIKNVKNKFHRIIIIRDNLWDKQWIIVNNEAIHKLYFLFSFNFEKRNLNCVLVFIFRGE